VEKNTSNYRPNIFLTSFSKVFEKFINSRLFTHIYIYKNDIPVDEQYGFRPNISTEIASLKLINKILVAMNNKMSMGVYFVTWRKLWTL